MVWPIIQKTFIDYFGVLQHRTRHSFGPIILIAKSEAVAFCNFLRYIRLNAIIAEKSSWVVMKYFSGPFIDIIDGLMV